MKNYDTKKKKPYRIFKTRVMRLVFIIGLVNSAVRYLTSVP